MSHLECIPGVSTCCNGKQKAVFVRTKFANVLAFSYIIFHFLVLEEALSDFQKNSSLIRQNGESQNGRYKKTKHAKFS